MARTDVEAIVIGGSAGALEALTVILPALPRELAVPIAITLHVHPDKPSLVAGILADRSARDVHEAEDKEPLAAGAVYVAPPNYHLLIERGGTVALSADDLVNFSRPAIDVLFDSAADAFGESLVGVLLTGANDDGARGLARIKAAGGKTIVQSPETSLAPAMPEAALRLRVADHCLPLDEIAPLLSRLLDGGTAA